VSDFAENKLSVLVQIPDDCPEEYKKHELESAVQRLADSVFNKIREDINHYYSIKLQIVDSPYQRTIYGYNDILVSCKLAQVEERKVIFKSAPIDMGSYTDINLLKTAIKEIKQRIRRRMKKLFTKKKVTK
jgi:hypothetical protein